MHGPVEEEGAKLEKEIEENKHSLAQLNWRKSWGHVTLHRVVIYWEPVVGEIELAAMVAEVNRLSLKDLKGELELLV